MGHVSYTRFREHLAGYMDEVQSSRAELHVHREGHGVVVVIAEDEYNSMIETLHLLRNPANVEALAASIADLDAGLGIKRVYVPRD